MMKSALTFLLVVAPAAGEMPAQTEFLSLGVTPVQKVISLMNGMVEKGKKEKGDEMIQFASFKTFCDNTVSQKQAAIAEANEMMEVLTADIEKYGSEAERLAG